MACISQISLNIKIKLREGQYNHFKTFARVIHVRPQELAERVYPESQCRFRSSRLKVNTIFSVSQLQEKYREQNIPLDILLLISNTLKYSFRCFSKIVLVQRNIIYLHARTDCNLYNPSCLKAKMEVENTLFAYAAALEAHHP